MRTITVETKNDAHRTGGAVLSSSFPMGVPAERIAEAHDIGARWIQQLGEVRSATLALEAGADVLVAQGSEAGGNAGGVVTMVLVPQVVDVAGEVPVLVAGGVGDGRGLAAALTLGAQGVMVSTRFLASAEMAIDPRWKDRILASDATDAVKVRNSEGDAAVHHRSAPGRAAGATGAPYAARASARSRAGIRWIRRGVRSWSRKSEPTVATT
jgi:NAD(P)H-dependent flavin oxidoreductase YrpB (nitropropane dioxygenase family)